MISILVAATIVCQNAGWADNPKSDPARATASDWATDPLTARFRHADVDDHPIRPVAQPAPIRRWHADPSRPGYQWFGADSGPAEYWWPRVPAR